MTTPRWLDDREARLWQLYRDLHRRLTSELESQLLANSSLSGADYQLLVPLSEAPEGVLRARDLGLAIGWDRSRLSHHVRRMEQRGLVSRESCPVDARGSMVRLTDEGRSAIVAAAPKHVAAVRKYFFDVLSREDQASLDAIFAGLLANLPESGDCCEEGPIP